MDVQLTERVIQSEQSLGSFRNVPNISTIKKNKSENDDDEEEVEQRLLQP